jgi:hypothetical protein
MILLSGLLKDVTVFASVIANAACGVQRVMVGYISYRIHEQEICLATTGAYAP